MSGAILIEYLRPGQNVHGHDLTVTLGPSNVTLGGFPCFDARVSCHGNALSAMHIPTHMVGETEEQQQMWMKEWGRKVAESVWTG